MSHSLSHQLFCSGAQAFEDLAFLMPMPSEHTAAPEGGYAAAAAVHFRGPMDGRLVLAVSPDLLPALAANMLGEDEPPAPEQQQDALGEMANVLCGNLLPAVAGVEKVFRLDAPRIGAAADLLADTGRARAATRLELDEGCAGVWLFVDLEGDQP